MWCVVNSRPEVTKMCEPLCGMWLCTSLVWNQHVMWCGGGGVCVCVCVLI